MFIILCIFRGFTMSVFTMFMSFVYFIVSLFVMPFRAFIRVLCVSGRRGAVPGLAVQPAVAGGGGAGALPQPLPAGGAVALGGVGVAGGHAVPIARRGVGRAGVRRGAGVRGPAAAPQNAGGVLQRNLPAAVAGRDWFERRPNNTLAISRSAPAPLRRLGIRSHNTVHGQRILGEALQVQAGVALPRTRRQRQPTTVWWVVDQRVPSGSWKT